MKINAGLLIALSSLLPVFAFDHLATSAFSDFSVYCSSNMDGTGVCTKEGTSETIECILLQGSIIGCKDSTSQFRCVQFGQIIANQAQFSCKQAESESETTSLDIEEKSPIGKQPEPTVKSATSNLNPFDQPLPKNESIMDGAF